MVQRPRNDRNRTCITGSEILSCHESKNPDTRLGYPVPCPMPQFFTAATVPEPANGFFVQVEL
jgi:hypothetical protein